MRQYEDALRHARAEVYRQQEAGRHAAVEERNRIVREARERANDSVRQAKLEIQRDVEQAKKALEAESERLAEEITRSLLAPQAGEHRA
jgi:F0F1-type ATP synthase membrane subunit b/b'